MAVGPEMEPGSDLGRSGKLILRKNLRPALPWQSSGPRALAFSNAGGPEFHPGQGTGSHLKSLRAAARLELPYATAR